MADRMLPCSGHFYPLLAVFGFSFYCLSVYSVRALRQEHTGTTVGRLKRLASLRRGREQICSVCSAVLEAFGTARTLSALIQHVKSEVGCRTSEPSDSPIVGVPANQRGVGGAEYCVHFSFQITLSVIPCFHVLQSWRETSCYYVRSGQINLCSSGNASLHV